MKRMCAVVFAVALVAVPSMVRAADSVEMAADATVERYGKLLDAADTLEDPALEAATIRSLPDRSVISARIAKLEQFIRAANELMDFMRNRQVFASQQVLAAGGSPENADAAVAIRVFDPDLESALRDREQANVEWASLTIQAYRLLQHSPGKWRFGRAGEKHLMFTDHEFSRRLSTLSRRIRDAGGRADVAYERMKTAFKKAKREAGKE